MGQLNDKSCKLRSGTVSISAKPQRHANGRDQFNFRPCNCIDLTVRDSLPRTQKQLKLDITVISDASLVIERSHNRLKEGESL